MGGVLMYIDILTLYGLCHSIKIYNGILHIKVQSNKALYHKASKFLATSKPKNELWKILIRGKLNKFKKEVYNCTVFMWQTWWTKSPENDPEQANKKLSTH